MNIKAFLRTHAQVPTVTGVHRQPVLAPTVAGRDKGKHTRPQGPWEAHLEDFEGRVLALLPSPASDGVAEGCSKSPPSSGRTGVPPALPPSAALGPDVEQL